MSRPNVLTLIIVYKRQIEELTRENSRLAQIIMNLYAENEQLKRKLNKNI